MTTKPALDSGKDTVCTRQLGLPASLWRRHLCLRTPRLLLIEQKSSLLGMEAQPAEEEGLGAFDPFLLLEIFGYLDWEHAPVLSLVNKHWASVVHSSQFRSSMGTMALILLVVVNFYPLSHSKTPNYTLRESKCLKGVPRRQRSSYLHTTITCS